MARAMGGTLRRGAMSDQGALFDLLTNVIEFVNNATGANLSMERGVTAPTASLVATAAELNRAADMSARIITLNATSLAISETHDLATVVLAHTAAASTVTLPAATGSGLKVRFKVGAVNTNGHKIQVTGDDTLKGLVTMLDNDSNAVTGYAGTGTDDTITLNGTTTGGAVGDWLELEDIAADIWAISGQLIVPAGSNVADPFTAAV